MKSMSAKFPIIGSMPFSATRRSVPPPATLRIRQAFFLREKLVYLAVRWFGKFSIIALIFLAIRQQVHQDWIQYHSTADLSTVVIRRLVRNADESLSIRVHDNSKFKNHLELTEAPSEPPVQDSQNNYDTTYCSLNSSHTLFQNISQTIIIGMVSAWEKRSTLPQPVYTHYYA